MAESNPSGNSPERLGRDKCYVWMLPGEIEIAVYHLERGRFLLEQQRARVSRLQEKTGDVPIEATQFLRQLEQTVELFEHHLVILRQELAQATGQIQMPQAVSAL